MDNRIEKENLRILIEKNGGVVSGKELQEAGFKRIQIYNNLLNEFLTKESHGYYVLTNNQPDEYTIIQKRSNKIVFSHATALYLQGLSDKIPQFLDITVPQGDNISRIKKDYHNTKFHYCKKELWDFGIVNVNTPQGYSVRAYDIERCICDLIRDKGNIDAQVYSQAIRKYFSGKKFDNRKIIKYSKFFNIEEKVRNYMEVLL